MTRFILRLVPEREHYLPAVQAQIPQLEIVRDVTRNAMDTFLLALARTGADAAVHLEDDIELTSDFLGKIEPEIAERSGQIINFFSRLGEDAEKGSRAMTGATFVYNLCFYLPPGYSEAIFEYYPRWPRRREHPTGYDYLIADWLKERRERYWLHVPSLVQHAESRSIINRSRSSHRQSATFRP